MCKYRLYVICICLWVLNIGVSKGQPLQNERTYFEGTISFEVDFKGADAGFITANEPNRKMDLHLKEGDYIVNLMGGKYPKTFLFVADSNREYLVDASKQIAYRHSTYTDRIYHNEQEPPIAKNSGKKAQVNGILCDVYLMKQPDTYFAYYVNDDYKVDLGQFPDTTNSNASFLVKGLEGRIPLKTIKKQKTLTVTTTFKEIKPQTFNPKQFLIPKSFKIFNRDYRY